MNSEFGWLELSPDALRRMRQELEEDGDAVLDEIGVLAFHSGYADLFFPGTSVLHTRPRYLFFTCWNLLALSGNSEVTRSSFASQKRGADAWVTERLKLVEGQTGIIGGRKFPQPPAQPPDFAYWTALKTYGFYRGPDRGDLARRWDGKRIRQVLPSESPKLSEEHIADEPLALLWCPPMPKRWLGRSRTPLSFELQKSEAAFLRERLMSLETPCVLGEAARLIRERELRWTNSASANPLIRAAAGALGQRDALTRASSASAMAELLRSIYGALVEKRYAATNGSGSGKAPGTYRETLQGYWFGGTSKVVESAVALDMDAVRRDIGTLSAAFVRLVAHVRERLDRIRTPADALRLLVDDETAGLFELVEAKRKGTRARLPRTPAGFERRRDFGPKTVNVYGLDYRWRQVFTMLSDIQRGLDNE